MLTPPLLTVASGAVRPSPALEHVARLEALALQLEGPERAWVLSRALRARATSARVRWADSFLFARIARLARGGSAGQAVGWLATAGEVRRDLAASKRQYATVMGMPMPSPVLPARDAAAPIRSQGFAERRGWGQRVDLGVAV